MINGCQLLQKNNKLVIDKFVPTNYTRRVDKRKRLIKIIGGMRHDKK